MTTPTLSLVEPLTVCHAVGVLRPASYGGPDFYGMLKDQTVRIMEKRLQPYGVTLDPADITWSEDAYDGPLRDGIRGQFEGVWAGSLREAAWCVGGPRDRSAFTPERDVRGIPQLVYTPWTGEGFTRVEYWRQGIRPEDGAWVYQYRPAVRR
jgi:hypothetical protein